MMKIAHFVVYVKDIIYIKSRRIFTLLRAGTIVDYIIEQILTVFFSC